MKYVLTGVIAFLILMIVDLHQRTKKLEALVESISDQADLIEHELLPELDDSLLSLQIRTCYVEDRRNRISLIEGQIR
jgi:hypothetical protein